MRSQRILHLVFMLLAFMGCVPSAMAHGEKAQQPAMRMRTVHWFDVEPSTTKLAVNDTMVVKGKFVPSKVWPHHVASIEETAFLNIGVPGPSFVRLDSSINGVPGIRSTSFKGGEQYEFEVKLKARTPGRYHVHPIINVKDAGPIIGPGFWVEVTGNQADFTNHITSLLGQNIDLESYGFGNAVKWSVFWIVVGIAWFGYWLTKVPLILPRFRRAQELGDDADQMILPADRMAAAVTLAFTLCAIAAGYMYANDKFPITTPLQTGKIDTPALPPASMPVSVKMDDARYRIPGRSFRIELTVTNSGAYPISIGEFATGNVRFINPAVHPVKPKDEDDLVAPDALRVEGKPTIEPGETRKVVIYADDAMWETQRMTTMIRSPDAVIAGMLFLYDNQGHRYPVEISGYMIPLFG